MMKTDALTIDFAQPREVERANTFGNREFGFWMYLMSDLILFSAIFATFAVLRRNSAGGPTGKELFDLTYAFGETMFLLFSSALCGLAVLAMHNERKGLVLTGLALTFLLGLGFISMEANEFHRMIVEGHGPDRSGFLSAFFTLVGTHGAHVTLGLIWMAVIMGQIVTKGLTTVVQSRLMRLSMFWHFLDIVWIGIFTFVYLMGVI
jgi:cytochrome o ubiquinol oxidase subunit III